MLQDLVTILDYCCYPRSCLPSWKRDHEWHLAMSSMKVSSESCEVCSYFLHWLPKAESDWEMHCWNGIIFCTTWNIVNPSVGLLLCFNTWWVCRYTNLSLTDMGLRHPNYFMPTVYKSIEKLCHFFFTVKTMPLYELQIAHVYKHIIY
jgi:hypothetical protein